MSTEFVVQLQVNGETHSLAVRANTTLLSALRDELDLTGSKRGCGTGDCGACTVLLDGQPVASCLTLAAAAEGKRVETVEGLATHGDLHPLQKAFVKHGALQ